MSSAFTPLSDPIAALADAQGAGVLAVITGVEGPSYRPLGACMAIMTEGHRVGSLSSGCIEADVTLHAMACLSDNRPSRLLYGQGSPFADIQLPCGGGLEITLLPNPDPAVLVQLQKAKTERRAVNMSIDADRPAIAIAPPGQTGWYDGLFHVLIEPGLRFFVFGKGPEASTFAAIAHSSDYETLLLSPDAETRAYAQDIGCAVQGLDKMAFPNHLAADAYSAIVLFFHDHEWEPPILLGALQTPAFYIGAQGSRRARDARLSALQELGASPRQLDRLKGPIGLVPSARDARTLAISVLSEILMIAHQAK